MRPISSPKKNEQALYIFSLVLPVSLQEDNAWRSEQMEPITQQVGVCRHAAMNSQASHTHSHECTCGAFGTIFNKLPDSDDKEPDNDV